MTIVLASDYTFQFLDTGIALGTDAVPNATFVDITSVQGLDSAPTRSNQNVREGQDGGFTDASFSNQRTIILAGTVYSPPGLVELFLDSLYANYAPVTTVQPFYFKLPGLNQRTLFCKSLGAKCDTDSLRRYGSGAIQIQLVAEDPTKYEEALTFSGGASVASSGYGFNKSFNYGYGGAGAAGGCVVTNPGNKSTGGIITLTNVVNAEIVNDNTDETLLCSLSIGAGLSLAIDLRNKTAVLNGTANRRDTITGDFFKFATGDTPLRFNGTSVDGTANISVSIRPAYY